MKRAAAQHTYSVQIWLFPVTTGKVVIQTSWKTPTKQQPFRTISPFQVFFLFLIKFLHQVI